MHSISRSAQFGPHSSTVHHPITENRRVWTTFVDNSSPDQKASLENMRLRYIVRPLKCGRVRDVMNQAHTARHVHVHFLRDSLHVLGWDIVTCDARVGHTGQWRGWLLSAHGMLAQLAMFFAFPGYSRAENGGTSSLDGRNSPVKVPGDRVSLAWRGERDRL